MNNTEIIKKALDIICKGRLTRFSNILYIGGDVTMDYLLFFESDKWTNSSQDDALSEMGVYYVAKYEAYGIERDFLWDNRDKK